MSQQSEPELFSFEWFCSLTDEELSDIGYMEAMIEKNPTYWLNARDTVSHLLAALAKRVKDNAN